MQLAHIDLGKLFVSASNMRHGRTPPDVSDILPTVAARGVIMPLLVRPGEAEGKPGLFGIVAGRRRYHAALIAAKDGEAEPLPCAIMEPGDDAAALEASLIENTARLDPDEVTQWATFTRLVKEGRIVADLSATFAITERQVRQILALGNLLPRIRALYGEGAIDAGTVRPLTLASKARQREWLALYDDPEQYAPRGAQVKAWLFGGAAIRTDAALFDLDGYAGVIVSDLFGGEGYFADADAFWTAQEAAIAARKADYLDAGWPDVRIIPPGEYFHAWEHVKAPKRKGGRVYVDVRGTGEVTFHEGYVTAKEARRADKGEPAASGSKPVRPEASGPMGDYIDLHRHAAVRAALVGQPEIALRLMVAHAIAGSALWTVRVEAQTTRKPEVRESVETCKGETAFDAARRAVLDRLGFSPEEPTVTGGDADPRGVAGLFLRLLDMPDTAVMAIIPVVMGETLKAGDPAVDAAGAAIGVDMADWWEADDAFFELIRDREILLALLSEVAGEAVARGNATEKGKTLKRIIRDHLEGGNGRPEVARWVPRWMAFPAAHYTERGGVNSVRASALVEAARADLARGRDEDRLAA
ncbi:chromosome partitioning protein ParB [Glycocaulis profundi]|nr:chromosome partitioning protein ParB [Glycocaulis profundi]